MYAINESDNYCMIMGYISQTSYQPWCVSYSLLAIHTCLAVKYASYLVVSQIDMVSQIHQFSPKIEGRWHTALLRTLSYPMHCHLARFYFYPLPIFIPVLYKVAYWFMLPMLYLTLTLCCFEIPSERKCTCTVQIHLR